MKAHLFLALLWAIPLAVIVLGCWLVLLIPAGVAAIIGQGALMLAVVAAVALAIMSIWAKGMRS